MEYPDVAFFQLGSSPDPGLLELLRPPLRVSVVDTLQSFRQNVRRYDCGVLAAPVLAEDEQAWLAERSEDDRFVPVVVVTTPRPDNLARLGVSDIDECIFRFAVEDELRPAVRRQALRVALWELLAETPLPAPVLQILQVTAHNRKPPTSLKAAYKLTGVRRKTVWKHYRSRMQITPGARLEDLQEVIAVMRCIGWKTPSNTWPEAVRRAGCSGRWLRSALLRCVNLLPADLDDARIEELQLQWLPDFLRRRCSDWVTRV